MNLSSESLIKCSFFGYRRPAGNQERKSPDVEKTDLTFRGALGTKKYVVESHSGPPCPGRPLRTRPEAVYFL